MVACIGTFGAHVSHTAVQATWHHRTVLSARRRMLSGAVARQPIQYSNGNYTVEYWACTNLMTAQYLPFLDTQLSTHLGPHGGM